jgi:hypothetical protein
VSYLSLLLRTGLLEYYFMDTYVSKSVHYTEDAHAYTCIHETYIKAKLKYEEHYKHSSSTSTHERAHFRTTITCELVCQEIFPTKFKGFWRWGVIMCKTALSVFVPRLNYSISTFRKLYSASNVDPVWKHSTLRRSPQQNRVRFWLMIIRRYLQSRRRKFIMFPMFVACASLAARITQQVPERKDDTILDGLRNRPPGFLSPVSSFRNWAPAVLTSVLRATDATLSSDVTYLHTYIFSRKGESEVLILVITTTRI